MITDMRFKNYGNGDIRMCGKIVRRCETEWKEK